MSSGEDLNKSIALCVIGCILGFAAAYGKEAFGKGEPKSASVSSDVAMQESTN